MTTPRRSTTLHDLRLVVTTMSLPEPQIMIWTGYDLLSSLGRNQKQR
jgi:hypothetical protein